MRRSDYSKILIMTVYIEYAILDNLVIDYLLLKGSARFVRLKYREIFLLLSSAVGTAFAVVLPLFDIADVYAFFLKILCAALMCLIAAKHRGAGGYFLHFNVFLLFSFVLGGAAYGMLNLFGIKYDVQAYYQAKAIPVGITILIAYSFFICVKKFTKVIVDGAITACALIDCELVIKGCVFRVKAFYDSGNFLEDKKSGLPVVIADKKTFRSISEKVVAIKRGEISVVSAGSRFYLPIYKIDYLRLKIKGKTFLKDAVLAVSKNMSGISGADILIGKNLAGGAFNVEIN